MVSMIKELIKKLDEKDLSQVDISGILMFANNNETIINELIKEVDSSKKSRHELKSDLLELILNLREKYNINVEDDEEDDELENDNNESTSVHTITYKCENKNDSTLHITYNASDVGDLKMLGPTASINYFSIGLSLAFMDLEELKNNTRESFEKIDLYKYDGEKMIYSFEKVINTFSKEIDNYSHIIIWSNKHNTSGYLIPYYFINKFLNKILTKKVILIYTDNLAGCEGLYDLKIGQFKELMNTGILLSEEELKKYSSEWQEIVSHKCDIRDFRNGSLEYKNIEDYFEIIADKLKSQGEVVRTRFIGDLMSENIIFGGIPDIYSYIIDKMIEKGIIISKDYKVPNFIPADKISLSDK